MNCPSRRENASLGQASSGNYRGDCQGIPEVAVRERLWAAEESAAFSTLGPLGTISIFLGSPCEWFGNLGALLTDALVRAVGASGTRVIHTWGCAQSVAAQRPRSAPG